MRGRDVRMGMIVSFVSCDQFDSCCVGKCVEFVYVSVVGLGVFLGLVRGFGS